MLLDRLFNRYLEEADDELSGKGGAGGNDGDGSPGADGAGDGAADGSAGGGDRGFKWPDNWREQMAGEDEKELKQIGRYATPSDIWKKARALEARISSGELKQHTPFPDKGTDEEKTAWREQNGIPATADKYEIQIPEETPEAEQTLLSNILERAHAANYTQEQAQRAIDMYQEIKETQLAERHEQDKVDSESAINDLREEWGREYQGNMNAIRGLLNTGPEGLLERFLNARTDNGTGKPLASDVDTLKWLDNIARTINPVTTLVPGATGDQPQAIDDEIAKIKEVMRTDRKRYNSDERMQKRYRQLLAARDTLQKRAG